MNTSRTYTQKKIMSTKLLNYYEAIEKASAEMLAAARTGNWDEVVKLEGACAVLIAQLKTDAPAGRRPDGPRCEAPQVHIRHVRRHPPRLARRARIRR